MVPPHFKRFCAFVCITSNVLFVSGSCTDGSFCSIRNPTSNLVVDGGTSNVTVQNFDEISIGQLWKFTPAKTPGQYFIINVGTGKALDIGQTGIGQNGQGALLALAPINEDSLNQQWHLRSNGRIENAKNGKNMDVSGANYVPGTLVNLWPDNGNAAQQFTLDEKMTCTA